MQKHGNRTLQAYIASPENEGTTILSLGRIVNYYAEFHFGTFFLLFKYFCVTSYFILVNAHPKDEQVIRQYSWSLWRI